MVNQFRFVQTKINKVMLVLMATILVASGLSVSKAFGAGGGDPCADGIPDAAFTLSPGTKAVGDTFDVSFDGTRSVACNSPIVSYEWNFGDGLGTSGSTTSHEYQVGTFRPSLTITDAEGLTNTRSYYTDIIVKSSNQAPVLTDASGTVAQGGNTEFSIASNASDPDGDDIGYGFYYPGTDDGYSEVQTPKGTAYFNANGTISFYARSDAEGQQTFAIGVRDGFGGEATATFTVNFDPRLTAVDDSVQTYKNTPITIRVKDNDFSYQNAPFDITWREWSNDGLVQVNSDGTITFTPNGGFLGTTSFDYYISSNATGTYYGSYGTVTVEVVLPPNNPPTAVNDSLSLDEDTPGSVNVLANDSDQDGDSLSVSLVTGPRHGTANLSPSGALSYTPTANYNGSDSVTYEVTDSKGAQTTATVNITVRSVNDLPTVSNDTATIDEDNSVNVNVLANDNDIESGNNLSVQIVSGLAHGTASVNPDGTVEYTPNANYNGSDSFTYKVTDANSGTSQIATVSIAVNSVNDAPTATFSALVNPSGKATFDASGSADVDGQIVNYQWSFGDGQSVTTTTPATSYKYRKGTYQVTLTVTDNQGLIATYTKTITI